MAGARVARLLRAPATFVLATLAISLVFAPSIVAGKLLATGDGLTETVPALLREPSSWNPAMFAGFPIGADPNKIFWYPLRLLGSVPRGVDLFQIFGYTIAALGVYGYVKRATGVVAAGVASAASFTFGGFEISHFGHPMLLHPAAWSCVALWATGEFQREGRTRHLAAIVLAVALVIVSGQPQIAAFAIAILIGHIVVVPSPRPSARRSLFARAEALLAVASGIAAAAVLWIPARHLAAESTRAAIDFGAFVADSLPLAHLARALAFPFAIGGGMQALYRGPLVFSENGAFTETSCCLAAASLALAATALIAVPKRATYFWAFVALCGLGLAVGNDLPFARLAYRMPIYHLFRIPGRHAFEFTLAASILAGLCVGTQGPDRRRFPWPPMLAVLAVAMIDAYAVLDVRSEQAALLGGPEITVFLAALGIQAVVLIAAVLGPRGPRAWLMAAAVVLGSLTFAETAGWRDAPGENVLNAPGWVGAYERLPSMPGQRAYTIGMDPALGIGENLPQIWSVPDIRGYTPLQIRSAHIFFQTGEDGRLLDPAAPTLDVAAVRYLILPRQSDAAYALPVRYAPESLNVFLAQVQPEAPQVATFAPERPRHATALGIVTALGLSVDEPQGELVADVVVHDANGRSQTFPVRAGIESSEIGYDRPEFAGRIKHRRATVFLREGGATWYEASWPIAPRGAVSGVEIRMRNPRVALNVRDISLIDRSKSIAYPLSAVSTFWSDRKRFRERAAIGGVSILENLDALPAAWTASKAIVVNPPVDDASLAALRERLRRIDVRTTALVANAESLPQLSSGGRVTVRQAHATLRIFDAVCPGACLLVSSERWDGGWSAAIDGRPATLLQADGILQAVAVPPGRHEVTFRYRSSSEVIGQLVSMCALSVTGLWLALRNVRNRSIAG